MDAGSIDIIPRYLFFIFLLLLGGAYFAAAETSFASVSKIRMISDADDGDKRAEKVLFILDNFDKALTTILIGNNIMHIACSSIATLLASKLWGNAGVTAATFVTAFTVFILAEMLPKSYASSCCEVLAPVLAPSMVVIMKVLSPVSFVFSAVSNVISKLFGSAEGENLTVTEEELFDIIEGIDEADEVDEDAAELVQSALEFTVKTVADVYTPWNKVETVSRTMSDSEILRIINEGHYSRLPVVTKEGNVEGILQIRKFLKAKIEGRSLLKTRAMLDRAFYVTSNLPIDDALDLMSSHKSHMAIVRSDDGPIEGIVTVEDILEELVGEIYDEEEKLDQIPEKALEDVPGGICEKGAAPHKKGGDE